MPHIKRPTIAVDIDEVLFPHAPTLLDYHNDEHGTSFTIDQMTAYRLQQLTEDSEEVTFAKIKAYLDTHHYSKGQPIQGSIDAIKKMRKMYRLVIITSRNDFYRGYTEEFIEEHFDSVFDEIHYTHNLKAPGVTMPKSEICKSVNAIALVDDHLHNVLECAEAGIQGILFGNYPWNQADELPEGVRRVKDWQEVLEYFDGKATK